MMLKEGGIINPEPNEDNSSSAVNASNPIPKAIATRGQRKITRPETRVDPGPYISAACPERKTPIPISPREADIIAPIVESLIAYALSIFGTATPIENL